MPLYENAVRDNRVREYLPSVRLVASEGVDTPERLIGRLEYQSSNVIKKEECCVLKPGAYIVIDFGREIHGGIRITTAGFESGGRVRVRFGESISEAITTPNQDHSIHDMELRLPKMGCFDFGSTGFRFVRIGKDNDGGYLVVNASAFGGPGCSTEYSFRTNKYVNGTIQDTDIKLPLPKLDDLLKPEMVESYKDNIAKFREMFNENPEGFLCYEFLPPDTITVRLHPFECEGAYFDMDKVMLDNYNGDKIPEYKWDGEKFVK